MTLAERLATLHWRDAGNGYAEWSPRRTYWPNGRPARNRTWDGVLDQLERQAEVRDEGESGVSYIVAGRRYDQGARGKQTLVRWPIGHRVACSTCGTPFCREHAETEACDCTGCNAIDSWRSTR